MDLLENKHETSTFLKEISGDSNQNFRVNFSDIVDAQQDENTLIIDIRNDNEILETGKLPGSIHIPMADVLLSLTNLTNEEFKKKFNRQKPDKESKIILSCRSGGRSRITQQALQKSGYSNVHNYSGGWFDWENHQKK